MRTYIQFPKLHGTFDVELVDNNGEPSTVLEAGKEFSIRTKWSVDPDGAGMLGGQWEVSAYAESIGHGPEKQIGDTVIVPVDGRETAYFATVTVEANTLPDDPQPPMSGIYKLVTVLMHRNFGKITDVAAVAEGPVVRIG